MVTVRKIIIALYCHCEILRFSVVDKNFNQIILKVVEIAHDLGYVAENFSCNSNNIVFEINLDNDSP